jgi:hypothetical protein
MNEFENMEQRNEESIVLQNKKSINPWINALVLNV